MKTFKRVSVAMLSLCLVICGTMFIVTSNAKTTKAELTQPSQFTGSGMDFSKGTGYVIDDIVTGAPKTFEMFVKVNTRTHLANGRYGVILGNFITGGSDNHDSIDLEIYTNGNPRLYYYNGTYSGKNDNGDYKGFDWKITGVNVATGEWTHIAYVRDTSLNKTYCYINGTLVATRDGAGDDLIPGSENCGNFGLGVDKRPSGAVDQTAFQGEIGYVALSSQTKSASQIQQSMRLMINQQINKELTVSVGDLLLIDCVTAHSYFRPEKPFTSTPNTITATFKLNRNYAVGISGTIFGNQAVAESVHGINLEVNSYGKLCIGWDCYKNASTNPFITFNKKDFRDGQVHHVAVVRDTSAKCFRLYDNGTLIESSSTTTGIGDDIVGSYAPNIGCDNRVMGGVRTPFKGYIYDVGVYSLPLTASQVVSEYSITNKTLITRNNFSSLMFNWVLDQKQSTLIYDATADKTLIDHSPNHNDARMATVQHYFAPDDADWFKADEDEYTLIFMPDTQITVSKDVAYINEKTNVAELDITKTFQWIADNGLDMNLAFVMHMGDLKHARGVSDDWAAQNDWREWQLISGNSTYKEEFNTGTGKTTYSVSLQENFDYSTPFGFEILRQAGIPYSTVLGNHDYDAFYMRAGTGRTADYYNYYFSTSEYNTYFADHVVAKYDDTMMNVIYTFSATVSGKTVNYLVVALEFGPSDAMIDWANQVVSRPEYEDYRVIFTSHNVVYSDGDFGNEDSAWNPDTYGYANDTGVDTNRGIDLWNTIISQHENMFMSSCGHISEESVMTRLDTGVYGNDIYSILFDLQDMFNNRGDSVLLVAKVNEKTQKITFKVYNPVNGMFYGVENQFEYDFSDSLTKKDVKTQEGVSTDKSIAREGEKVSISLENGNYKYATPTVTDKSGNLIAVSFENGEYFFNMPSSRVTVACERLDLGTITLPDTIVLTVGDSVNLAEYLPNLTFTLNGEGITALGTVVTATQEGSYTVNILTEKYGAIASAQILAELPPEPESSSEESAIISEISSETISEISSEQESISESVVSTVSEQPTSEITSTTQRTGSGCGASLSGMGIISLLALLSLAIVLKKLKAN